MKPHRLTFAGIGAYPGTVEIDFDDLGELGLYLVVGPTGSGKTTIFDAITFGLYGQLAGARDKSTLVSDHGHRVAPFVEIDFSHRGGHYRVRRVPPVNGKSAKTNDVWLSHFADDTYAEPPLRTTTGATKVSDEIAELIGLDADQFMRVMLLPQNEFQQFLLANSTDKEKLLRALFGTTLFERIAWQLTDSARQQQEDAAQAAEQVESVRASIRGQIETVQLEGLGRSLPDPVTDLPGVIAELSRLREAADAAALVATEGATAATAARATAATEAKRFDAGAELADLEQIDRTAAADVDGARRSLALAERADRVVALIVARATAHRVHDAAADAVSTTRADLCAALAAVPDDVPVLHGLRAIASTGAPSAIRAELTRAHTKVDEAITAFRDAAHKDASSADLDVAADSAEALASAALERTAAAERALTTASTELVAARALADTFIDLDREVVALEDLIGRADVSGAASRLVTAHSTLEAAASALRAADDALSVARRARTMHLAGELAAQLVPGEPCPVCGSVEHPSAASTAAAADVDHLEQARDVAKGALAAAEAAYNTATANKEVVDELAATLPSPDEQAHLRQRHAAADAARSTTRRLERTIEEARAERDAADADRVAAAANSAQHRRDSARLRDEATTLRATAVAAIDEAVVELVAHALDEADHFIAGLESAVSEFESATGARRLADEAVANGLLTEGFSDEQTAHDAALDTARRAELDLVVTAANERSSRIVACRAVVGDSPLPATRPDLDHLLELERAANDGSARATAQVTTLANASTSIENSAASLAALAPDVERRFRRALRAKELAATMQKGSGTTLGLERWVQRAVFEEVCDVASVQLLTLSAGRYVLTLEASGRRSGRRTAGLDLFVTDSHTGATRSVGTLSGGEQFLTSLALALALAEVVQRRSGSIELATLFIDEGFGSLDGETLDTAVEVLRSLQDTGRTVGVISHVEAMQQELRTGIRVTPSPSGSTLVVRPASA